MEDGDYMGNRETWAGILSLLILIVLYFLIKDLKNRLAWRSRLPLIISGVLSFYLGWIGIYLFATPQVTLFDSLYQTMALFTLNANFDFPLSVPLQIARFTAPLSALSLIILTFTRDLVDRIKVKIFYRKHIILCGLGRKGVKFAQDFLKQGFKIVVIEKDENNQQLNLIRGRNGVTIFIGNANDETMLRDCGIDQASFLMAITKEDEINIEITAKAFRLKTSGFRLKCYVHVCDMSKQKLFKRHNLFEKISQNFDARIFSLYDLSAKNLLSQFPPDDYLMKKLEAKMVTTTRVSIAVAGEGNLVIGMLKQIALTCHYSSLEKTQVLVLTENITHIEDLIYRQIPQISELIDYKLIQKDKDWQEFLRAEKISIFFISFDHELEGFNFLLQAIQRKIDLHTQIVFCIPQMFNLTQILEEGDWKKRFQSIVFYPLLDSVCRFNVKEEDLQDELAIKIHEEFCKTANQDHPNNKPWEMLEEEIRDSNRNIAEHMKIKQRVFQLYWDQTELTEEVFERLAHMEHNRWIAEKRMGDYLKADVREIRDDLRRIHPLLVPWEELDPEIRNQNKKVIRIEYQVWKEFKEPSLKQGVPQLSVELN